MLLKSLPTASLKLVSFLLIAAALTASSCSSGKKSAASGTQVSAIMPSPQSRTLPSLPESVINLPVQMGIKPYLLLAEKMAPKEINSLFWPDYLYTSCDFRYKYHFLRSDFKFSCANNRVTVLLNGNYQIAGSKTVCVLGKPVSPWVNGSCGFGTEAMRRVNISLVSDLSFTPDFRLQTNTRVNKVTPVDKCLVTVFNNDVTSEILDSIGASVNTFGKNLDLIVGMMNFENIIHPLAEKAGKKIPLSSYGWLKLNASELNLGPINYSGDTLSFTAGISCFPEISSDSINYSVSRHLPPLKGNIVGSGFSLHANALYDYTTIDTLLTRSLRNREFDVKGEKIKIASVQVVGLDNYKVQFTISFFGTKRGTLVLTGSPQLDPLTQTISVPDLDYDLNSSSITLVLGKTFFNRRILEQLKSQASLKVTEIYQKNKPKIDVLFNREISDGIKIKGNSTQLRLTALVIKKDNLQLQANLTGNAAIVLTKIPGF